MFPFLPNHPNPARDATARSSIGPSSTNQRAARLSPASCNAGWSESATNESSHPVLHHAVVIPALSISGYQS